MNRTTLPSLRDLLATFYGDKHAIRRIVDDVGLDASRLDFDGSTQDIWHAILREVEHQHKLDVLFAIVDQEYASNRNFQTLYQRHRQASRSEQTRSASPTRTTEPKPKVLASSLVLLLIFLSVIVWGCQSSGTSGSNPPNPEAAATSNTATSEPAASPTATEPVAAVAQPAPAETTLPFTSTLTVTAVATLPPTATTLDQSADLHVLDEVRTNIYLIEGSDSRRFAIGDNLVVYGELIPGTESAIALLKVIGQNPDSLTAQALLIDPTMPVRTRMRVDGELGFLPESQLVPVFEYAVGYLLREGRVRLRPGHGLVVGAQMQALEFEYIDEEIIDAFKTDTLLQVTDIGQSNVVAAVALVNGEWPVAGTILSSIEASASPPTVDSTTEQSSRAPNVLFTDDFDQGIHPAWQQEGPITTVNGKLTLNHQEETEWLEGSILLPRSTWRAYRLKVELNQQAFFERELRRETDVLVHYQDPNNYLALVFSDSYDEKQPTWFAQVEGQWQQHRFTQPYYPNHSQLQVDVEVTGDAIVTYLDGRLVDEWSPAPFDAGAVGLLLKTKGAEPPWVDTFIIEALDSTEPSSTTTATETQSAVTPALADSSYPCEAEIVSPRGVVPVTITFRQRPNEGSRGTQSYQPGDKVIIKQADGSGNWYLIAELSNLERGWASAEYFTDCSTHSE